MPRGKSKKVSKAASKKSVKKKNAKGSKTQSLKKWLKEIKRARSAYMFFVADSRAAIMGRHSLKDGPTDFAQVTQILSQSWKDASPQERDQYAALAELDQHRNALEKLQPMVIFQSQAIGNEYRGVLACMSRQMPLKAFTELLENLTNLAEDLDNKMNFDGRRSAGSVIFAKPVYGFPDHVKGTSTGVRLARVLKKWRDAAIGKDGKLLPPVPTPEAKPKKLGVASASKEFKSKPKISREAEKEPPQDLRQVVVGRLMRVFAKGSGQAAVAQSKQIEEALFALDKTVGVDYKRKARSLFFNLSAKDDHLRNQVLEGKVTPHELVRMDSENLASTELQKERAEEREKYFRSEVHDTVGPIRRKRDLIKLGAAGSGQLKRHHSAEDEMEEQAPDAEEQDGKQEKQKVFQKPSERYLGDVGSQDREGPQDPSDPLASSSDSDSSYSSLEDGEEEEDSGSSSDD